MAVLPLRFQVLASLAAVALLVLLAWPRAAQSQIRQCEAPDGRAIFTDRSCENVGAHQAAPGTPLTGHPLPRGCARNVRELVREVSAAIDLGDVNRLAGVYHWAGMSGGSGNVVMDRLQALVGQPLLHVGPVTRRRQPRAWSVLDDGRRPRASAPSALQLEQLRPDGGHARTTFNLHEHFGCVWLAG